MWGLSRMLQFLDFTRVAQRCKELRGAAQWDEAKADLVYADADDAAHVRIVDEMKQRRASLVDAHDAWRSAASPLSAPHMKGYARSESSAYERGPARSCNLSSVHRDLDALDLRLAELSDVSGWPNRESCARIDSHGAAAEVERPLRQLRDAPHDAAAPDAASPRRGETSGHQRPLPLTRVFDSPSRGGEAEEGARRSAASSSPPPMVTVEDAARTVVAERQRLKEERRLEVNALERDHSAERGAWLGARRTFEERCANAEASAAQSRAQVGALRAELAAAHAEHERLRAAAADAAALHEVRGPPPRPPPHPAPKESDVLPGECSLIYRYITRESCSQFDSLPLTSLTPKESGGGAALAEVRAELAAARRQNEQDALVLEQSIAEAAALRASAARLQEESARFEAQKSAALRSLAAAHAAAERADADAAAKLNSVVERLEHARGEVREHRLRSQWVPKSAATAAIPLPPSASRQTPAPRRKPRSITTRRESISVQTKTETRETFTLVLRRGGALGVHFSIDPATCLATVHGAVDARGALARDNPGELAVRFFFSFSFSFFFFSLLLFAHEFDSFVSLILCSP
jgi:hypothetical protein